MCAFMGQVFEEQSRKPLAPTESGRSRNAKLKYSFMDTFVQETHMVVPRKKKKQDTSIHFQSLAILAFCLKRFNIQSPSLVAHRYLKSVSTCAELLMDTFSGSPDDSQSAVLQRSAEKTKPAPLWSTYCITVRLYIYIALVSWKKHLIKIKDRQKFPLFFRLVHFEQQSSFF